MNIKQTTAFVGACDVAGASPLIEGLHGVGKSDSIRAYAKSKDMHCEVLILSLMDIADLIGIPRTTEVGGSISTVWAAPSWYTNIVNAALPSVFLAEDLTYANKDIEKFVVTRLESTIEVNRAQLNDIYCEYVGLPNDTLHIINQDIIGYKKAKRSVLFLDEFNRAPMDVLNSSLQLVLDKRLHSHILPRVGGQNTLVVAAINPAGEDYTVNEFDPALLDRFAKAEIEADAKGWLEWAADNGVNEVVRSFIAEHPDRIHFIPKNSKDPIGCTPRSWTQMAKMVDNFDTTPPEIQFNLIKGCIGKEVGSQFLTYYRSYSKVLKLADVEKAIKTARKKTKDDVEATGAIVKELIKEQEVMQKSELAQAFLKKYIDKDDAFPLLAYLYGLDIEVCVSLLKELQGNDTEKYMKIAALDGKHNDKQLFRRIIEQAQIGAD